MTDVLNREDILELILKIFSHNKDKKESCSFSINGEWGSGKSWILKEIQERVNEDYVIIRYNAWENDFYEEPLIAILTDFGKALNKISLNVKATQIIKEAGKVILNLAGKISSYRYGIDFVKEAKEILDIPPKKEVDILKSTLKDTQKEINKITKENHIIILVDELDRCLPSFAIKTLERLHHLFEKLNNCTMVFAIDKNQLDNTIMQIYGKSVQIDSYLKKFIDFNLKFDNGTIDNKKLIEETEYKDLLESFDLELQLHCNYVISQDQIDKFTNHVFANINYREVKKLILQIIQINKLILQPNQKIDASVLLFELLITVLIKHYKMAHSDIYNIVSFKKIFEDDFKTNSKFYNYFSKLFNEVKIETGYINIWPNAYDETRECKQHIENICLYLYMHHIYAEKDGNILRINSVNNATEQPRIKEANYKIVEDFMCYIDLID